VRRQWKLLLQPALRARRVRSRQQRMWRSVRVSRRAGVRRRALRPRAVRPSLCAGDLRREQRMQRHLRLRERELLRLRSLRALQRGTVCPRQRRRALWNPLRLRAGLPL
jgi:hypothetical protein